MFAPDEATMRDTTRREAVRTLAAQYLLLEYGEMTPEQAQSLVPRAINRACVAYDATRNAEVPDAT